MTISSTMRRITAMLPLYNVLLKMNLPLPTVWIPPAVVVVSDALIGRASGTRTTSDHSARAEWWKMSSGNSRREYQPRMGLHLMRPKDAIGREPGGVLLAENSKARSA